MSDKSKIQWTDATWNPTTGCTRVSSGCDNCYAVETSRRQESFGRPEYTGLTVLNNRGDRHFNGVVRCHDDRLQIPLRWRKPRRIFVNSQSDLFHKAIPFEFIDKVFAVMALCPQHTFQVLTKRPERMAEYFDIVRRYELWYHAAEKIRTNQTWASDRQIDAWGASATRILAQYRALLANVWLGTSVEDQGTADERIPHLLRCPAAVRFVSYEPALGPIDFGRVQSKAIGNGTHPDRECFAEMQGLDWLIIGGESGKDARPFDIAWARSAIEQCKAAGVACFVKQLGSDPHSIGTGDICGRPHPKRFSLREFPFNVKHPKGGDMSEWPEDLRVREYPKTKEAAPR